MVVHVPNVLTGEQVGRFRTALENAEWIDGRATAGHLSARVKQNRQLPEAHPTALRLGQEVLRAIETNSLFMAAALPHKIVPPLFNCYAVGETYGAHIDGAVRPIAGSSERVRTDLSVTLFLSEPEDYLGGELIIEETARSRSVKLPAGDLLLYPGNSVHRVEPVKSGTRLACFFWIQSMVRSAEQREILFDLQSSIGRLSRGEEELSLTRVYHGLVRMWADI